MDGDLVDVKPHIWSFPARVTRVVDGDTIDFEIDCGFKMVRHDRGRLLGVDTPEMRGEERLKGLEARTWVSQWLSKYAAAFEWPLIVRTEKEPDAFGRLLVRVWRLGDGACLNDDLLAAGQAVPYEK